jgi:hypothetical protein
MVFSVVHRHPLSRPDKTKVEAKLGKALALLEIAVYARVTAVVPLNIADVPDEPVAHLVRLACFPAQASFRNTGAGERALSPC